MAIRAALYNGPERPITIESIADPEPGPADVLVEVHRCGICGSDLAMTAGGPMQLPLGRFGHEWSGEIVAIGRDVANFSVGQRIAALPSAPCGVCAGCRDSDNPLYCEHAHFLVGGFGEYMAIPAAAARPLPHSLSFADGALVEPMACGLHALRLAQMRSGERVLVIGAGSTALSVVFWARHLGAARVAVLSRSTHRHDAALQMGADVVLDIREPNEAVVQALGGRPDIVAECVGKRGIVELAIEHVRPRGTVLSLGMCAHGEAIVPALCTQKEIKLLFPHAYTVAEFVETARVFDADRVRPELMVSHVIGLDELPATMNAMRSGELKTSKVHVDPMRGT